MFYSEQLFSTAQGAKGQCLLVGAGRYIMPSIHSFPIDPDGKQRGIVTCMVRQPYSG